MIYGNFDKGCVMQERDLWPLLNVHIIDYSNKITGYSHEAQQVKNRSIV